jgi:hypothetical protein
MLSTLLLPDEKGPFPLSTVELYSLTSVYLSKFSIHPTTLKTLNIGRIFSETLGLPLQYLSLLPPSRLILLLSRYILLLRLLLHPSRSTKILTDEKGPFPLSTVELYSLTSVSLSKLSIHPATLKTLTTGRIFSETLGLPLQYLSLLPPSRLILLLPRYIPHLHRFLSTSPMQQQHL